MNGRIGRLVCTAAILAMCTLVSVPAQAKTKSKSKCEICHRYSAKEGSRYCYSHTCHWRGKGDITCSEGIYTGKYCSKHICKEYKCDEPVYFDTDVQACRYHYRKYESQTTSKTSSSSTAKTCKYPGCRNYGVSYKKGYCNKHYKQLYEKRDDYYDEDPESYYQDNKSMYKSRSEAYDDWEDEYEED